MASPAKKVQAPSIDKKERIQLWQSLEVYCVGLMEEARSKGYTATHRFTHSQSMIDNFIKLGLRPPNNPRGLDKFIDNFIRRCKYLTESNKNKNKKTNSNNANNNNNNNNGNNNNNNTGNNNSNLNNNNTNTNTNNNSNPQTWKRRTRHTPHHKRNHNHSTRTHHQASQAQSQYNNQSVHHGMHNHLDVPINGGDGSGSSSHHSSRTLPIRKDNMRVYQQYHWHGSGNNKNNNHDNKKQLGSELPAPHHPIRPYVPKSNSASLLNLRRSQHVAQYAHTQTSDVSISSLTHNAGHADNRMNKNNANNSNITPIDVNTNNSNHNNINNANNNNTNVYQQHSHSYHNNNSNMHNQRVVSNNQGMVFQITVGTPTHNNVTAPNNYERHRNNKEYGSFPNRNMMQEYRQIHNVNHAVELMQTLQRNSVEQSKMQPMDKTYELHTQDSNETNVTNMTNMTTNHSAFSSATLSQNVSMSNMSERSINDDYETDYNLSSKAISGASSGISNHNKPNLMIQISGSGDNLLPHPQPAKTVNDIPFGLPNTPSTRMYEVMHGVHYNVNPLGSRTPLPQSNTHNFVTHSHYGNTTPGAMPGHNPSGHPRSQSMTFNKQSSSADYIALSPLNQLQAVRTDSRNSATNFNKNNTGNAIAVPVESAQPRMIITNYSVDVGLQTVDESREELGSGQPTPSGLSQQSPYTVSGQALSLSQRGGYSSRTPSTDQAYASPTPTSYNRRTPSTQHYLPSTHSINSSWTFSQSPQSRITPSGDPNVAFAFNTNGGANVNNVNINQSQLSAEAVGTPTSPWILEMGTLYEDHDDSPIRQQLYDNSSFDKVSPMHYQEHRMFQPENATPNLPPEPVQKIQTRMDADYEQEREAYDAYVGVNVESATTTTGKTIILAVGTPVMVGGTPVAPTPTALAVLHPYSYSNKSNASSAGSAVHQYTIGFVNTESINVMRLLSYLQENVNDCIGLDLNLISSRNSSLASISPNLVNHGRGSSVYNDQSSLLVQPNSNFTPQNTAQFSTPTPLGGDVLLTQYSSFTALSNKVKHEHLSISQSSGNNDSQTQTPLAVTSNTPQSSTGGTNSKEVSTNTTNTPSDNSNLSGRISRKLGKLPLLLGTLAPHNDLNALVVFEPARICYNILEENKKRCDDDFFRKITPNLVSELKSSLNDCLKYLKRRIRQTVSGIQCVFFVCYSMPNPAYNVSHLWYELCNQRMDLICKQVKNYRSLCHKKGISFFSVLTPIDNAAFNNQTPSSNDGDIYKNNDDILANYHFGPNYKNYCNLIPFKNRVDLTSFIEKQVKLTNH